MRAAIFSLLVVSCACARVEAGLVFNLHNHPKGGARPPLYGFRLDELVNVVTGEKDIFTFDFDDPLSDMKLEITFDDPGTGANEDRVRIFGTTLGGYDTGAGYDSTGYFDIDFSYTANIDLTLGGGSVSVVVTPDDHANNKGTITPLAGSTTFPQTGTPPWTDGVPINLVDEDGDKGFSFKFNNTDNHRSSGSGLYGPTTYVGWGWVNHSNEPHVKASDWLFTATFNPDESTIPIPEPSTLALLGIGSIGLIGCRRRRNKTTKLAA